MAEHEAIAKLRATGLAATQRLPWFVNSGWRVVFDASGERVASVYGVADAYRIAAAVNAAPHLLAELDALRAQVAAAREAVWKMRTGHRHDCACCQPFLDRGCDCGEELIATARLALGLGVK